MVSANMLKQTASVQRATLSQSKIGGTKATWDNPQIIVNDKCSIQSASPTEMEKFSKRGVDISHKIYFTNPSAANIIQGDRVVDARYTPVRYLIVAAPPEDLAARGSIYGIFANLQQ